jgi:hypothetical protein
MGLILMFIIIGGLATIMDGLYFDTGHTSAMWSMVSHFQAITILNPVTALYHIAMGIWSFIVTIFHACIWDYGFLTGGLLIVRIILCAITLPLYAYFVFDAIRIVRAGG